MNAKCSLVAVIACVVGSQVRAEDKKADYAKLIVGKWEVTKTDADIPEGAIVEFTKDGKIKFSAKKGNDELMLDGSYKLTGDKFEMGIKIGEEEKKQTITITKLDEKTLVTKDKDDKVVEFTKKK